MVLLRERDPDIYLAYEWTPHCNSWLDLLARVTAWRTEGKAAVSLRARETACGFNRSSGKAWTVKLEAIHPPTGMELKTFLEKAGKADIKVRGAQGLTAIQAFASACSSEVICNYYR